VDQVGQVLGSAHAARRRATGASQRDACVEDLLEEAMLVRLSSPSTLHAPPSGTPVDDDARAEEDMLVGICHDLSIKVVRGPDACGPGSISVFLQAQETSFLFVSLFL
jgi:hypothetical protein